MMKTMKKMVVAGLLICGFGIPVTLATSLPAQGTGDGTGGAEVCYEHIDVPARDVEQGAYTCKCTTYFLGIWDVGSHSVPCQRSVDTYPPHGECTQNVSTIERCVPFGTVPVRRQNWKCKVEIAGPDVEVGGVSIGIGMCFATCERDGAAFDHNSISTAIALECH